MKENIPVQAQIKIVSTRWLLIIIGLSAFSITLKNSGQQSPVIFEQSGAEENKNKKANSEIRLEIQTFKNDSGWGYNIYREGKLYIHQPHIPAIAGNQTFRSEEDAIKTGRFIIVKIRKNILPPSVTLAELDSLGIFIPIYQR